MGGGNDSDYIFGLAGNAVLDALVAEVADNLRFRHAASRKEKLRTFTSFMYQASRWKRSRKGKLQFPDRGRQAGEPRPA